MARKPKSDEAQSKRFIETAKKLEVDENPEAFERAFKKVVPQKPIKSPPRDGA